MGEIVVGDYHQKRSDVQTFNTAGLWLHVVKCPKEVDAGVRGVAVDTEGRMFVAYNNIIAMHPNLLGSF